MAHVPALEPVYRASTAAALVAIVAVQMGNLFACRSEHAVRLRGSNRLLSIGLGVEALIVALLFALPGLARVFHMAPLPAAVWALMLVWPPLLLGLDALWKMVRRSGCDTGSYAPAARSRPM
jgi:Ca2+-transporting ATPase